MKDVIRHTTLADRALFFFLVIISAAGIFIVQEAMPEGSDVTIEVDGRPEYTFPIDIDRVIQVKSSRGNMVVEIRNGKVRVAESDCPRKICVQEGWISRGVIVCLPNKVLVFVGKGSATHKDGIDAITG